jgi:bifunctional non-homologous end joining protein LigD
MTGQGAAESVNAGGISVGISNPGKVFFPDDKITKGELAEYYLRVAPDMLPYLEDRPLALARYPDGITGHRIFQKNVPGYFPDWISRVEVARQDGTLHQVVADKPATLVYLANQGCVELHPFLSQTGAMDRPDQLIFDLDPPDRDHFGDARRCALLLRDLLHDELGLTCFAKTTGGDGLHVQVPLNAREDFNTVRGFARRVAETLAARNPDWFTTEQRKETRANRLYLDIMRNGYAQTAVAPYSVRARPGAPVATPLRWEEVADPALAPRWFTLRTIPDRLGEIGRTGDPWAGMSSRDYGLAQAGERLEES